jgi:HD-GYP domain-containing protein (c-di-GMP phosphodiesterase class II)
VDAHGSFLYRRAAGTAAVATTLGRQLGFDHDALVALASGGLLLDLGKIAVPVTILAKPGMLDSAEQGYVRRHVERSLELVAGHDVPERALEMIVGHHERLDGSGYPHQLNGTQIPLFGRIAAIADAFDAMTLDRRYAAAMSPHAALRQLDSLRDHKFDAALVTELTHAMGIYPVGTVVELTGGEVGLVCGQRRRHPLQPLLIVTHGLMRQALREPYITVTGSGSDILRALPPQAVTVDAAQLEPVLRSWRHPAA